MSARPRVVMLLGNGLAPDPRVEAEAKCLADAGADLTVLGWDRDGDLPPEETRDGYRVQRIRRLSGHGQGTSQVRNLPGVWREFVARGAALRPDVVHAHDLDTLPAGWRLARKTGALLVFDAHESYPDMLGDNVAGWVRWGARRLERFLVPRADLLVTVGEKLRRHFDAMGARESVVVGNWRDPLGTRDEVSRIRQAVRVEAGLMPASVFILFIANLTPERKLEPLLAAVESVPGCELVVGGKGSGAEAARAAAARCPRIRYIGAVRPDDVARWTAGSDAVYYGFEPTNANAAFSAPNKLFEALAAGVPVITARFGEIGEVVAETGCGILIPDYTPDAIASAIRDLSAPGRADGFRRAAESAGARFTRAAADRALVGAYARIGASRGLSFQLPKGEAA